MTNHYIRASGLWFQHAAARRRLAKKRARQMHCWKFQHAAARRRLVEKRPNSQNRSNVSTRSRPKAAGRDSGARPSFYRRFQHAAARRRLAYTKWLKLLESLFQHAAARRRLGFASGEAFVRHLFQHAAARRRLAQQPHPRRHIAHVSTRSRPKAAGSFFLSFGFLSSGFNTQPPEGGWKVGITALPGLFWFQHAAARRRLAKSYA